MPAILIADSRSGDRALLVRALERLGWVVWYATTAEEAQLSLSAVQLDFVVASSDLSVSGNPSLWSQICEHAPCPLKCPVMILPGPSRDVYDPHPANLREHVRELTRLNSMVIAACKSFCPENTLDSDFTYQGPDWCISSMN
jgi:hypothetical protein